MLSFGGAGGWELRPPAAVFDGDSSAFVLIPSSYILTPNPQFAIKLI